MDEGTKDKVSGTLKEAEGKLTGDKLREKQGAVEKKVGEAKDKLHDLMDDDEHRGETRRP